MAVAWSWAFDTPFKWTKQIASHFGGTRQGMAISWPARIKDAGGMRTSSTTSSTSCRRSSKPPACKAPDMVDGIKQKPIEGVSMVYTFDKANANAAVDAQDAVLRDDRQSRHLSRRLVRQHDAAARAVDPERAAARRRRTTSGSCTTSTEDYSQANDLAAKMPDKLKQMQALFDQEAAKYNVLPLNNDTFARALAPRPSATAGKTVFTYTGVNPGIPMAQRAEHPGPVVHDDGRGRVPQGRRQRHARHRWADAGAAMGCTC